MRKLLFLGVPLLLFCVFVGQGDSLTPASHTLIKPDSLQWGPGPPQLPPGGQAIVLQGDPSKEGPYTLRSKLPDGYVIPPHWHPSAENVTVLSGTLHIGMGETFDKSKSEAIQAGGFLSMPAQMRHFAWIEGETVLQVHGMGPFDITYINPADDPRNVKP